MQKRIFYILGNIFYYLKWNRPCAYFLDKADAIAEEEYNKLVVDFYENGKGYYGRR